ncbi:MAG: NAD(P)/FAD-dependent oxidoreductase [Promethearchaeota archaeon]
MFDVAVAGAGPAGATVARYLAKAGHSVCLIDKDEFPRDKPCGGGFSPAIVDEFPYLKKRKDEFVQAVCRVGVLHSPNQRVALKGKADMAVALRSVFDNVLYECAKEAGANVVVGQRIKNIAIVRDGVSLGLAGGNTIRARAIVGADGASSLVARSTGLNRSWSSSKITACRVAEIPATEREIINTYTEDREYHFFANFGGQPGYGWLFPKTGTINVGLGIVGKHSKGLPQKFRVFVRHLKRKGLLQNDADLHAAKGALVPTGGPIKDTVRNRCVLVGDSAGMVNPLTGGGIIYAMKAARIAARSLSGCLEQDQLAAFHLMKYHDSWLNDFGGDFKSQLLAQRIFTGFFTDTFFEIGSRDKTIQETVSSMMSEGSQGRNEVLALVGRFLYVCLREAIF